MKHDVIEQNKKQLMKILNYFISLIHASNKEYSNLHAKCS